MADIIRQVLTNSDLLDCIFKFVPLLWESEHRDLAQCAVVCRAFHEPVIRILWRTVGTLFPLWHLLAPLDVPFPFFASGGSRLEYLQTVSAAKLYDDPTRWDRFLWHTSHIRNLVYVADPLLRGVNEVHLHLLRSVLIKNGGNTVLPLLRSINWSEDISAMLRDSSLSPLLAPTLRHASIYLRGSQDHLANVTSLRRLRESSPFLEIITLDTDSNVGADLSLARELASFDRLHEIRLPSLSGPEVFEELVTQSNIGSLALREVRGPWVGLAQRIPVHRLLELDVCGTIPCLTGLFDLARFEALRTAQLSFVRTEGYCRIADIILVLEALRSATSPGRLQNLTLFAGLLSATYWLPSSPCPAIHSFNFFSPVNVVRHEDEDIAALAHAWPHLERLSLYSGLIIDTAVSVAAVHHLYTHCPCLKEVSLSHLQCPAIGVHAIPGPQVDRVPPHPLQNLFIGEIEFALAMAEGAAEGLVRYFLDLFPRLDDRAVHTRSGPLRTPSTS
ncbi:hypothetical protein LXA43DRAFT_1144255 [Ganoderma leucocontextum]|nr:hypothetical protein LXA43DRAFT_1144255 [Ganoderma leucocontextum]